MMFSVPQSARALMSRFNWLPFLLHFPSPAILPSLLALVGMLVEVQPAKADYVAFFAEDQSLSSSSVLSMATTNYGGSFHGNYSSPGPAIGTPAYNVFHGKVTFTWVSSHIVQELPDHCIVAHVLSRMNPNRRYRLQGTAVRGGGYMDRWTLFELGDAVSFLSAHTSNCLTSAQVPTIASNQVAINTGDNKSGDLFDWQNVIPSREGIIVIYSRQYTGTVPGGSSSGTYGYAMTFLRVEEIGTTPGPPVITEQPQSVTVMRGTPAVFSVKAHAFGSPVSYTWLKNGSPIGLGSSNITLLSVQDSNAGTYSVRVYSQGGTLVSSNAELAVVEPDLPKIIQQPISQYVLEGGKAQFSVAVQYPSGTFYQWQFNGQDISRATNPTLTRWGVQTGELGDYRVVVRNKMGSTISSNATLRMTTVGEAFNCDGLVWVVDTDTNNFPAWFPQAQVTHGGRLAMQSGDFWRQYQASTLRTTVQGPCTLKFKTKTAAPDRLSTFIFQIDGVQQFLLSGNSDWKSYSYHLSSSNSTLVWQVYPNASSQPSEVRAWLDDMYYYPGFEPPSAIAIPEPQTALAGSTAILCIPFDGYPPLLYQWQYEGRNIPGATNAWHAIPDVQLGNAGTYTMIVTNLGGSTSTHIHLSVAESSPVILPQSTNFFAVLGGDVWLHARAQGSDPRFFQWRFENVNLPGETNEVLKIQNVDANHAGRYSVEVSNALGTARGPDLCLNLTQVRHVIHISGDGLGSRYLSDALASRPERYPWLSRLWTESSGTLNGRCDYSISVTVPNHISMLTGRPVEQPVGQPETVHHGYTLNNSVNGMTIHNYGNTNTSYKASAFDVAHDAGLTTAFLAGKSSLDVCHLSYNVTNGAPDLTHPDNGRNKIDSVLNSASSTLVDRLVASLSSDKLAQYTFLHFSDMDSAGHLSGWGSSTWFDQLATLDAMLGRIVQALETNSFNAGRETVIILTADHGGGVPNNSHTVAEEPVNFTIPVLAWGPGFPAGKDLHTMFVNRADPGTNRVDYNAPDQPLRNGDTANIALMCLGLPSIPGSSLTPLKASQETPRITTEAAADTVRVEWTRAAVGWSLESAPSLDPGAPWLPVTNGIQATPNTFRHTIAPADRQARFFRLKRAL